MTELTHHDDIEVMAGDTWVIDCTLLDEDDSPLDLTDAELFWTLLNPDGYKCLDIMNGAIVDKIDPLADGKARITVPYALTADRISGRYTDALRVVIGTEKDTLFHGMLVVDADPSAQLPEELA